VALGIVVLFIGHCVYGFMSDLQEDGQLTSRLVLSLYFTSLITWHLLAS
jgi:hypothetical protein